MTQTYKAHHAVRAEPVEALPPFDKLRVNGIGFSSVMKSLMDQQEYSR
jgi:hypothetical protein